MKKNRNTPKLTRCFLSLLLILSLAVTAVPALGEAAEDFGGATLNVYNWGEYIDEGMNVIRSFEKKYNCRVNYKTYESNEILYTQIEAGDSAWDILVPSDYMVERLIAKNMLQPLDKSIITEEDLSGLTEGVKNLSYDPDNTYSVPYLWQSVGIAYDKTKIDPAVVEEKGWEIFLDPAYAGHTDMYDSERDAFMIALKSLGYSANTENEEEIQAAYEWLLKMNSAVNPFYVTDEVIEDMSQGYRWLALIYSGDAAYAISQNENMEFCAPKQGTNIAVDAMVIPANARNPRLANLFIKHIMSYDSALAISADVGYASPNDRVLQELSGPGGDYEGNSAYLPRFGYEKDEIFHDSQVLQARLAELWIKVMSAK
ncbi:MAG: ABC transporter substrate-binding protein [Clostridiales bacterium]|nr:ABC transporter substrate-binding protein [Clostridiales bacterium]